MMRWHVEIIGHSFDVEELPSLFTAPEFRVLEDEGRYFLEATKFEALTESAAVRASAKALLPQINGIAKLKNPSFRGVDVGPIREHGEGVETRQHVTLEVEAAEVRLKAGLVAIKIGGEEPKPPVPGSLDTDDWVRAASLDANKERALVLWGRAHDPTNLWKVWELVRKHSGIAVDADTLRRFGPALNDAAISGDQARHEVPVKRYPVERDTMSLAEAESFLRDLLTQWLTGQG